MSNGKKVVIGYGSAKFNPTGKGEVAVPTSGAYKESCSRFLTIPVDEFRSTKIYNGDCKTVLKKVISKKTGNQVRGLLWCCSTIKGKSKFINRDLNAALNILDCLVSSKRPIGLCRSKTNKALKTEIGKIVKR